MGGHSRTPDCEGWATRYGVRCSDGVTIGNGAFAHEDGNKIPVVYQHNHTESSELLGHAILKHESGGVRAKVFFDDTPQGDNARKQVRSGTLGAMSIYAKNVQRRGNVVSHADLVEVSLVLRPANPEARIYDVALEHSGEDGTYYTDEGEIVIESGEPLVLQHDDSDEKPDDKTEDDSKEKTVGEIYDGMTEEQKRAVAAIVLETVRTAGEDDTTETERKDSDVSPTTHNVFERGSDSDLKQDDVDVAGAVAAIGADMKKGMTFKQSLLVHAESYGISNPEMLFPEPKDTGGITELRRDQTWANRLVSGVTHLPFSRFRSRYAVLTGDEIRARGYITGSLKYDTVYKSLKRQTSPTTVVVKTKLDRDDQLDITTIDIWEWMKRQLTIDMNEELARAFLIGDGRDADSADKINPDCIRPILAEDDLYAPKYALSSDALDVKTNLDLLVEEMTYMLDEYRGKSEPLFWAPKRTIDRLTWLRDKQGRRIYRTRDELASAIGCSGFVNVPLLKGAKIQLEGGLRDVFGVFFLPSDYNVGTDNGGQLTSMEGFDIDHNQRKALQETRCSGALRDPGTAVIVTGALAPVAGAKKDPKKSTDPQLPEMN